MCPAYRQYCMITCATDPASIHALDAMKRPGQYGHPPSSPPRSKPSLSGECCFDTWEDVVGRNDSVSIPPGRGDRRRGMEGGGPRVGDIPPRSPGADSFNILRRKRQAAVSVDYESITKELPQVRPFKMVWEGPSTRDNEWKIRRPETRSLSRVLGQNNVFFAKDDIRK